MEADFEQLARNGASPANLAGAFLREYFADRPLCYPINPFQMLRDCGVVFAFKPLGEFEGVYIPASAADDIPVVGVNLDKPIARQRFTAAHELCHHLKDRSRPPAICPPQSTDPIEKYAERFAAELLMPEFELARQANHFKRGGYVGFENVLRIAQYFGVSFAACLNQLAYKLHVIDGDISSEALKARRCQFRPDGKRKELGFDDACLCAQVLDAADGLLEVPLDSRSQQSFEAEYVFHDSRMEGVNIDQALASEIVVDLRLKKQASKFCHADNSDLIEVAGLAIAYDHVFQRAGASDPVTIYDLNEINRLLFSTAVYPEFAGGYRQANPVVRGGGFETADYHNIPHAMNLLGQEIDAIVGLDSNRPASCFLKSVLTFHHKITVVHPFRDGNGRSIRAFTNLLLLRRGLPPALFEGHQKASYKKALAVADENHDINPLFELYCKQMLKSHAMLTSSSATLSFEGN